MWDVMVSYPKKFRAFNLAAEFIKFLRTLIANQGWEFAHSLIAHLLISLKSNEQLWRFAQIAQDKWATVSKSLWLLRGNEQPWANRSGRSRQMSDRERFAQKILAKKSKI